MTVPSRVIIRGMYGKPTLVSANNGRANWVKGDYSPIDQKGSTGWLANLFGGVQTNDDWARVNIPVNEQRIPDFNSAQSTWYQTNAEVYGVNMVIWLHDPNDHSKRVEVTQAPSHADLAKAQGWNGHILNTATSQFFYVGEGVSGSGLTSGAANQYKWTQYQSDVVFGGWRIYRISFEHGWYSTGTFDDVFVAEISLNGEAILLQPTIEELSIIETKSSGLKTSDVAIKTTPGVVYELTVSDTAAAVIQLNDSTNDSGADRWGVTMPADGYAHFIFQPPLRFKTGIFLDIPTGSPDVYIEYV